MHLMNYFDGEVISLHARGFAKLVCFKDHAREILKWQKIAKEMMNRKTSQCGVQE